MGLLGVNHPQTTGDHDGLVVAALLLFDPVITCHGVSQALLVLAEITQQIGAAKFVVERRAAQGPLDHDLQGAGDVLGLAVAGCRFIEAQRRRGKAGQTRLGLGAAPGRTFVTNLATRAGGRAGEGGNGGWVVMGFHLHQNMVYFAMFFIATHAYSTCGSTCFCHKPLDLGTFHHRSVVRIRHQHVLRVRLVRVADHAKHAFLLRYAVDGELGVKNFVAAVLAVGLREHHQLDIGGVALQLGESLHQVVDFVAGERQAKLGVGRHQSRPATLQHIHMRHGGRVQLGEQAQRLCTLAHHALGHAVVQQSTDALQLRLGQGRFAQKATFEADAVFDHPLYPFNLKAAVVRNVGGLGGPG